MFVGLLRPVLGSLSGDKVFSSTENKRNLRNSVSGHKKLVFTRGKVLPCTHCSLCGNVDEMWDNCTSHCHFTVRQTNLFVLQVTLSVGWFHSLPQKVNGVCWVSRPRKFVYGHCYQAKYFPCTCNPCHWSLNL